MLPAEMGEVVIELESDAYVDMIRLRKNVSIPILIIDPVMDVHPVTISNVQFFVGRFLHHVDCVFVPDTTAAKSGGTGDNTVCAIAAEADPAAGLALFPFTSPAY